jgi:hypothetical protein
MPLGECLRRVTHREYRLWTAWFNRQWDRPSRSDYYLMQIATEVRRVLSTKPQTIKMEHARLRFRPPEAKPPWTPERVRHESEIAKARLRMVLKAHNVPESKVIKTGPGTVQWPPPGPWCGPGTALAVAAEREGPGPGEE